MSTNKVWNSAPKPFKFYNIWSSHYEFLPFAQKRWSARVFGTPMYILLQKQKDLKKALNEFGKKIFGNIPLNIGELRSKLEDIQRAILNGDHRANLIENEKALTLHVEELEATHKAMLHQKS